MDVIEPSIKSAPLVESASASTPTAAATPSNSSSKKSLLRVATHNDITAIDRCNRSVLPENYSRDFYDSFFDSSYSCNFVIDVDDDKREEEDSSKERPIAGYILATAQNDNKGQVVAHIYSIGIYPQFRRRGYATELLQAVETTMKKRFPTLKYVSLHVRKNSNKGAVTFYCKNGYNNSKVVKRYYEKRPEDALLMKKHLD